MQKNNVGVVLVVSVFMSFIMGALGGIIVLGSGSEGNTVVTHNGFILDEVDSISKGVDAVYDAVVVVEGFSGKTGNM